MFDAILVPLDGSRFGEFAIPYAEAIADATGSTVHIVHVYDHPPPADLLSLTPYHYEGVSLEEYDQAYHSDDRNYLERFAVRVAGGSQAEVQTALLEGPVLTALERYSQRHDIELVVMSTHGRTGVSRAWLGSVADTLARHLPIPMLLARPGKGDVPPARASVSRLLVPLDGSPLAESALEPAGKLAAGLGSRVTLLQVVCRNLVIGSRSIPLKTGSLKAKEEEARGYLDGVAERLRRQVDEVETKVIGHSSISQAILESVESCGADLVAMSSHGHAGVTRAILGSVADKVLRAAHVPVLLQGPVGVREEAGRRSGAVATF